MHTYLYKDRFVPKEEVLISPEDRGYYFGDGVYEVYRVYSGRLFEPEAHYKRLKRTAEAVRIELPYSEAQLYEKLNQLIDMNGLVEGTVYLQATRGAAPRSHPFPAGAESVVMAYCTEMNRPLAAMESGIRVVTMEDIRWLRCDLKTLNLLPNVLAKQHALDNGAADVVLHRNGTVTECSASNIMMVKDGVVCTHPADNLILHGVTRAVVIRLAAESGIRLNEKPFTLEQLKEADEVFITGTTVEVTPVIAVDGTTIGGGKPGPVTRELQEAFQHAIG